MCFFLVLLWILGGYSFIIFREMIYVQEENFRYVKIKKKLEIMWDPIILKRNIINILVTVLPNIYIHIYM